MHVFKFRSAALAFVLLHVIGVCVDLVGAAVSCPPPNDPNPSVGWVDCENGYDANSPLNTCFANGGTCDNDICLDGTGAIIDAIAAVADDMRLK